MSARREINGNNLHGKRKALRKNTSNTVNTAPANFNCNSSSYNVDNVTNYPYCPNIPNQNIFPAVSDPSLCYPYLSYQMPYEPISLPTYNLYQPYSYRNHSCGPLNSQRNFAKPQDSDNQEFSSLPVYNNDLSDSDNQRRFSDPGIPNDCDISDSKSDKLVLSLIEQVNYLKDSNRKLYRELQDMKSEMSYLKHQVSARFYDKEYEPGMLSDIVREIRDAARIREEALLSRVKHMIEERQMAVNHLQFVTEKARNNERIGKLEDQLKNLCLNTSHASLRQDGVGDSSTATDEILEHEQNALMLRRDLQEAIAGKKDAEAKISQLDQILKSLRQGIVTNDLLTSSDDVKTVGSVDNCSVTTKSSSPIARVVMSGPVTSL